MSVEQFFLRNVRRIPDLFRNEPTRTCLSFNHSQKFLGGFAIATSQFVVSALTGEQRPAPSNAGPIERSAVRVFAIAVVVVPMPDRACRRAALEQGIDHDNSIQ